MNKKRKSYLLLAVSVALVMTLFAGSSSAAVMGASSSSAYDAAVLADQPKGYWPLTPGEAADYSGNSHLGVFTGSPLPAAMPNGDIVSAFNGSSQYFTIADHDDLELTTTGILTIEAWMRPDTLQFSNQQSTGYVHWMGKGTPGQHSWAARMYSYINDENRPNRISGYAFNLSGGLGAGSYFQDPITAGEWIHYTLVINTVDISTAYPTGYTKVYKNGVLRDQDSLAGYSIVPGNGTAPIRIATRDMASFFEGAIGKVAIYDYELTSAQLLNHYNIMMD
ncbi:LamG domain-containing protein [Paenibacillus senegalensis]|uniref:LamG domain-containing protein n=1 Tax=Paenibacillus senegalensis TaxID=1465766 RepID=UPI0002895B68|nr:LamG domain-containing protein [Paenibacillus senegalensis]